MCAIHILSQDLLTPAQIDKAGSMLDTFYVLLPELYGIEACTINVHLSHLTMFVKYWGPLWTQSAFSFESKHGQIKQFFHARFAIYEQLLSNVDAVHTLQIFRHQLTSESPEVLDFLDLVNHHTERKNMTRIASDTYIVGKLQCFQPTAEELQVIGTANTVVQMFSRLCKEGVLYHSLRWIRDTKRNNTICCFENDSGSTSFGEIEYMYLTAASQPWVLVRVLQPTAQSITSQAGQPCRPALELYTKTVDNYITSAQNIDATMSGHTLTTIPVKTS